MIKPAVSLRDLGICCALGGSQSEVLERALVGDTSGMAINKDLLIGGGATVVGSVQEQLPSMDSYAPNFQSRNNQLALHCLQQIQSSVERVKHEYGTHRLAVVVGTSTSGIAEGEQALKQAVDGKLPTSYNYTIQEMGAVADFIRFASGVGGPAFSISTACSSSAQALISAKELIASGVADAVICGGVDSLCQLTVNGFHALESLSEDLCLPFSANRNGINIGEGGALFLLERGTGGIQLLGTGSSSDAHHMSAPHPQGRGAVKAIHGACHEAQISPAELDYINLHGTATQLNDAMESYATTQVGAQRVAASSTKPLTGHTLGAAGAIEVGLCWLLLSDWNPERNVIPHVWDEVPDPELRPLRFATGSDKINKGYCLSNSFAFGGSNVSIVIGRAYP